MIVVVSHIRVLAWQGVLWRAHEAGIGNTTDRWQDKGARCVSLSGRVISRVYGAKSHRVWHKRSLRIFRLPIEFKCLTRCVGLPL
jgi:hypothetical protein